MSELEKFDINLVKLRNEEYNYQFSVGEPFFKAFEGSPIETGSFHVEVKLVKSETMIQLFFQIEGFANLICDRSLEAFDHPIKAQHKLILKFGFEAEQVSDEMEMIASGATSINIAQYIYEYVNLAIPYKKLHPRFIEDDEDSEDDETIFIYSSDDKDTSEEEEQEYIDPRWQSLKKFKK